MKKLAIIILSVIMVGCSASPDNTEPEKVYNDGTYTSIANGYGGEFKVETTLKNDKITDVVVKEHNETPSIGGVAIEQLVGKMKEKNTYDVDIISGATKTSQALKDAVKNGLEQSKKSTKEIKDNAAKDNKQNTNK